MFKDKRNCPGKILTCRLSTGTVDQGKGVVSLFRKLQCMRKAVMHRTDIGKAAAGIDNGKLRTRITVKEEQSGVFLCRIRIFLSI